MITVAWDAMSTLGRKRKDREDHYFLGDMKNAILVEKTSLPREVESRMFSKAARRLLLVSDGVGGQKEPDLASLSAAEALPRYLLNLVPWSGLLREEDEDDLLDDLKLAMRSTGERLRALSEGVPGKDGMAASLTLALLVWPRLFVVHAGHSRAYLHRPPALTQITTDHTVARQLQARGVLEEEEVRGNPWNKVLWNTLGGEEEDLFVEVRKVVLHPGDGVLLCTDGLTGQVPDDRIRGILEDHAAPEDACLRLVEAADEAGGKDNATAVFARFERTSA